MIFADAAVPLIGGHRGASALAPENTFAAFDLALAYGAELMEFDVHLTQDAQLAVHHDFTTERTAGQNLPLGHSTLEELRQLEVGSWFGPRYAGQKIPTLSEVLDRYADSVYLNVEIKAGEFLYPGIAEKVAEAILSKQLHRRAIVSCFDWDTIAWLRKIAPSIRTGLLAHDRPDDTIMHGYMMGATAVHLDSCLITAERVHQAHNIGMAVLAWTVNERLEMERVVELGVDAVLSDYPQRLCALVRERRVAELVC